MLFLPDFDSPKNCGQIRTHNPFVLGDSCVSEVSIITHNPFADLLPDLHWNQYTIIHVQDIDNLVHAYLSHYHSYSLLYIL